MTRRPVFSLPLNREASTSLQEQLTLGLRNRIRSGLIEPGCQMPSSREFARDLGVSRNTIVAVYERLLSEGYLESRPRSGIVVTPDLSGRTSPARVSLSSSGKRRIRLPRPESQLAEPQPFRPCQPDVRLFPLNQWNRIRSRLLRASGTKLLNYQSRFALGLPALRQALAIYLTESRGVRCHWQQIAITCGSQQAVFLLSQLLLKPGDSVLMEDPGYVGARQAFQLAGASVLRVAVDDSGMIPPANGRQAKLIYSTPSRQFPTGASLPVARRMQLIDVARQAGAWLLEDDYDSEFRYSSPPLPSMHSLDATGRVIYLGSMSKVLFPSLRIGYVVLPPELIQPFESLRLIVEDHGPLIDQATLAEFIESGLFYAHIRRCRKAYGARVDAFLSSMHRHEVPLTFPFPEGGMNQTGYLTNRDVDADQLSELLAADGFDIPSLSRYTMARPDRAGLVFGFTAFTPRAIQSAIARLAPIIRNHFASRHRSPMNDG